MSTLLHIESSPRKTRSTSLEVAKKFMHAYGVAHPEDILETLDLWSMPIPEFDGHIINAKYRIMHGQSHTLEEVQAWEKVQELFTQFHETDKYLFSVPMWNFGIPYKLKHFIDVITQPGLAFTISPEGGYTGLVTGKPAVVIYSRGGSYAEGSPAKAMDFQQPYLRAWLHFIGFTDVQEIVVEPTIDDPETVAQVKSAALQQAEKLAQIF